jgi:SH3-like domain-containing protein
MSVRVRRVDEQWLVEIKGQPIGVATSECEARRLADYWSSKLQWVKRRRLLRSLKRAVKAQWVPLPDEEIELSNFQAAGKAG